MWWNASGRPLRCKRCSDLKLQLFAPIDIKLTPKDPCVQDNKFQFPVDCKQWQNYKKLYLVIRLSIILYRLINKSQAAKPPVFQKTVCSDLIQRHLTIQTDKYNIKCNYHQTNNWWASNYNGRSVKNIFSNPCARHTNFDLTGIYLQNCFRLKKVERLKRLKRLKIYWTRSHIIHHKIRNT